MELKDMVGVGQAGLSAVVEGVTKARDAIPDETLAIAEQAKEMAVEAAAVAKEKAAEVAVTAKEVAEETARRGRSGRTILLGVVLAGAATAAGYLVYKRRQAPPTAAGDASIPAPAAAVAEEFQPGVADADSPDVVDDEFAKEIDEAADEFAQDLVDAVESEGAHLPHLPHHTANPGEGSKAE